MAISFRSKETRDAIEKVESLFAEEKQLEDNFDSYDSQLSTVYSAMSGVNANIKALQDKIDKLYNTYKIIRVNLSDTYNDALSMQAIINSKKSEYDTKRATSRFELDGKQATFFTAKLDLIEKEIDKLQSDYAPLEKEMARLEGEEAKLLKLEQDTENRLNQIDVEVNALRDVAGAVNRKINREGRQKTRQDKRATKKATKEQLRATYGKGKDYRTAKKVEIEQIKEKKKGEMARYGGTFGRRVWDATKSIGLVVPRNAYLSLASLNVFNIGKKLNYFKTKRADLWSEILKRWEQLGGKPDSLEKAMNRGKDKKAIFNIDKNSKFEAIGTKYYNVTGVEDVLAYITAGATIIASFVEIFKKDPNTDPTNDGTPPVDPAQYMLECTQIVNGLQIPDGMKIMMLDDLKNGVLLEDILAKYGVQPRDEAKIKSFGFDPKEVKEGKSNLVWWIVGGSAFVLIVTGIVILSNSGKKGK